MSKFWEDPERQEWLRKNPHAQPEALKQHIGNEEAELRRVYHNVHENLEHEDKLSHDPYYASSKKNIGGKE